MTTLIKQALERLMPSQTRSEDEAEALTAGVHRLFTYAPWNDQQVEAGIEVKDTLAKAYVAIIRNVEPGPTRTRALNHLVDARMTANAAITFPGE